MELGAGVPDRYKKITYWKEGVDELLTQLFIEAHQQAPAGAHSRHRYDRFAAARQTGRAVLPRLLRRILLFAAVCFLRRAGIVRPAA